MDKQILSVSEFVSFMNQTLEFAYPSISIEGEVSEFRISKQRWVYFNLTDDNSSVKMFGTVYQLNQPIEDGMKVIVKGTPRLHNKYGFSINISNIRPSGEGSIKRAFELLKKKLTNEGIFNDDRKRPLPDIPARIGLITSAQAAAYSDFMKIINQRWSGLEILHADVTVQGDKAPGQIVRAIDYFSQMSEPVDILVITRGGGGADDLMAFSSEEVARAVAGSRIPTIVGVGHEVDISLADLAADVRATTPTNAAQLVVPDKAEFIAHIDRLLEGISYSMTADLGSRLTILWDQLSRSVSDNLAYLTTSVDGHLRELNAFNPMRILERGYSLVTDSKGQVVSRASDLAINDEVVVRFSQGKVAMGVINVEK